MKNIDSLIEYVDKQVEIKFGDNAYFWMRHLTDKENDDYDLNLNIFHYIFTLGDDGKTYLWNEYVNGDYKLSEFCENDFNNDELIFLKSIEEAKKDAINKYGYLTNEININKPIETDRLILKAFNLRSSIAYDKYFYENQDEFKKYYRVDYGYDVCSQHMNRRPLSFAIFLKDGNIQIGSVCFTDRGNTRYNVEYFIIKEYRNKGYAYEALNCLIDEVKNNRLFILKNTLRNCVFDVIHPNIRCLQITTGINNIASQKMAEKAGFTKCGTLLFQYSYDNKYCDEIVYYLVLNEDRIDYSNC
jgi:RimJ/RimL family protein N-acetyltransferase